MTKKKKIQGRLSYTYFKTIDHKRDRKKIATLAAREYGVGVNCQGGIGYYDPNLQWLLKRGYIKIVRVAYGRGWVYDISNPYRLRRTTAFITDEGKKYLSI